MVFLAAVNHLKCCITNNAIYVTIYSFAPHLIITALGGLFSLNVPLHNVPLLPLAQTTETTHHSHFAIRKTIRRQLSNKGFTRDLSGYSQGIMGSTEQRLFATGALPFCIEVKMIWRKVEPPRAVIQSAF